MKTVNAYLIKGAYNTLIDTGENTKKSWQALEMSLRNNGLTIKDIDKIIITHAHVDHIGMASRVSQESGAKVHVSELVLPWAIDLEVEWERRSDVMKDSFGKLLSEEQKQNFLPVFDSFFGKVSEYWENISEDQVEVFDHKEKLDISGKEYKSIHCPGHSWTQSCFLDLENGDFFSADMLLKMTPTCVIEPNPSHPSERNRAMPQLIHSFKKLKDMDIEKIYPGHYEIMDNHKELIQKQLNRIYMRRDQVYDHVQSGISRFLDLFNALYGGRFNFPGIVMTLGYLDMLQDEGRIKAVETDDGLLFETDV